MKIHVSAIFKSLVIAAALLPLVGCVTGMPIHARSELAKENTINRIAVFGTSRVVWPRMGAKEPVIGLESSKQTLEATLPLIQAELTSKGYQQIIAEPVGIFANPKYKDDWVFPAKGEFRDPEEKTDSQVNEGASTDVQSEAAANTANFGKPYRVESKKPVFVYDGYAKDENVLKSARSVFDFLDEVPMVFRGSDSTIASSNPPTEALRVLGARTGADTLCFARVSGNRFTTARKAAAVAMNAATIWFGVVVLPPQDTAMVNLTCYDASSGKLAWSNPYGAYLGDPEKPTGNGLKTGFKYFPAKGKPMIATCKRDESKPSLFSCTDSESADSQEAPPSQVQKPSA